MFGKLTPNALAERYFSKQGLTGDPEEFFAGWQNALEMDKTKLQEEYDSLKPINEELRQLKEIRNAIDYATSGIIPIYVPSDAELEKVQISPDDPYAGMITSICDFNEDGNIEKIVVDYRDILADGIAVPGRVIVYDADGNVQWNDIFALAYAGWCRFYIAEIDNSPYLIRYFPPIERQGNWECSLQVYSMNSDNEFIMSEVISCDGTKESVEECKAIAEQYLEHAVMLVSTMYSELKVYK